MTTGATPSLLSQGACKSLVPRPGVAEVDLIFQVSASVSVVGIPPFQHCLALFDGADTIPVMLSSEVSSQLEPMVPVEKTIVAVERVGWWDHPRGGNPILVVEAMHIIEDREDFIVSSST
ncbi:hypothetical protein B0H11DRAFT_1914282 [Mycena galericulata]|nr:hypothetical protein B0H11DRAFT_1914282 [Mycena galericulata]